MGARSRLIVKRSGAALAAVSVLSLAAAVPGDAVGSYNSEPAPERTEVGALVVKYDRDNDPSTPDVVRWSCSGTMIDENTFLTAAHCIANRPADATFYVSLAQDVQADIDAAYEEHPDDLDAVANAVGVQGVPTVHPDYRGPDNDTFDIAVVEVPSNDIASRWSFTPATLPTANQLGDLGSKALRSTDFWIMGYGTEEAMREPGGHVHPGGGVRMKAPLTFDALNKAWLRLLMIEAQGNGGACFGDSGGPNFADIDGELVLVALTITGDVPCYATNVTYRLDTEVSRTFLSPFVALP